MAEKTVSQIINGVAPITYDTAEKFELALGVPADFWNRREMNYREALARVPSVWNQLRVALGKLSGRRLNTATALSQQSVSHSTG